MTETGIYQQTWCYLHSSIQSADLLYTDLTWFSHDRYAIFFSYFYHRDKN